MARGATWDPDLEERVGDAIGRELRAIGANLTGAVCINLLRHPAWGRAQETYGEDPHHVGELGAALTRGLQRHVMACVKHFACNSMENARFSVDIEVDDVALHEVYLPHFRRVVDEGVASVMSAYNSVNGEWCGQNRDCSPTSSATSGASRGSSSATGSSGCATPRPRSPPASTSRCPTGWSAQQHLPGALERGEVSWDDVDRCVERVIATLLRFDDVLVGADPSTDVLGSPEHRALAREVAARSVVLLRNEPVDGAPVLPLRSDAGAGRRDRSARRHGQHRRRRFQRRLGPRLPHRPRWAARVRRRRRARRRRRPRPGRRRSPRRPTSPSSSSATRTSTRASTSARPTRRCRRCSRRGDEPDVVELFAGVARRPPADHEARRTSAIGRGGFSLGGDRSSLRLLARRRRADPGRGRRQPADGRRDPGRQRGHRHRVDRRRRRPSCRPGTAVPGRARARRRAPRRRQPVGSAAVHRPRRRGRPARVRPRRHHVQLRPLARLVAPRPHGATPAFPFGFGLSYTTFALGDVDVVGRRRTIVTVAGDGAQHRRPRRRRRRPGLCRAPRPRRPAALVGFARVEVPAGGDDRLRDLRADRAASPPATPSAGLGAPPPGPTGLRSPASPATRTLSPPTWTCDTSSFRPPCEPHTTCTRYQPPPIASHVTAASTAAERPSARPSATSPSRTGLARAAATDGTVRR